MSQYSLAEPLYKISDSDIKAVINQMNKYEQCVYPEIREANGDPKKLEQIYAKLEMDKGYLLTVEDIFMMNLKADVLPKIIGKSNTELLLSDRESLDLFIFKHETFNHSNPADEMTDSELVTCLELKQAIERLKAQERIHKLKQERRKKEAIDCKDSLQKLTYTCIQNENNQ